MHLTTFSFHLCFISHCIVTECRVSNGKNAFSFSLIFTMTEIRKTIKDISSGELWRIFRVFAVLFLHKNNEKNNIVWTALTKIFSHRLRTALHNITLTYGK